MNDTATDKIPTPEEPSAPTEPQTVDTPATEAPATETPAPQAPEAETPAPVAPTPPPTIAPSVAPTPPPAIPPAPALPPVPPPPSPADTPKRSTRLVRSRSDKMIGGVCGGLAKVLNIDPLILRLALVLATVLGFGAGVVLYVACWILMPEEDQPTQR